MTPKPSMRQHLGVQQDMLVSLLHACVLQDVEKLDKLVTKLNKDKVG